MSPRRFVAVTALVVLIIVYGSLYPFMIAHNRPPEGAVLHLLETVDEAPVSRGDALANILLYMPYGFFALLSLTGCPRIRHRLRAVTLSGVALSATMELLQFFDAGRVSNFSDLYVNGLGTLLGAIMARQIGPKFRFPFARQVQDDVFPALLLASWFLFRLYPYVPTINLHKYWHALWPLIRSPSLALDDLFRFVVCWCLVANLVETMFGRARGRLVYGLLGMLEILGKIFILNNVLKLTDVIGIFAGPLLWRWIRGMRRPRVTMAWLFAALVVISRLMPFRFGGPMHDFSWIPFRGFMQGSIAVDTQSFLEKFFYYGAMLWVLIEAGLGLVPAAALLALGLFLTSLAETALPDRSAEITDAVMALAIAWLYRAIAKQRARLGVSASEFPTNAPKLRSAPP